MTAEAVGRVRLDKWLWAARFFKTRRLAADAIRGGKVAVGGVRAKPAKEVRLGDTVSVTKGPYEFVVVVDGLSERRGPAPEAQRLYHETEQSVERREELRDRRRAGAASLPHIDHRPDRRDRRRLAAFKRGRGD